MTKINRRITLAARPTGFPQESDFQLVESPIPTPGPGEFLIRTIFLSVDPYMRSRMNDRPSYAPPVGIGEVMVGNVVGQVIQSNHQKFPVGVFVEARLGWQEYAVSDGVGVRSVNPHFAPLSAFIGVLGMPGLTAYFGLFDIGKPKPGETVLVSGAAGAVGSVVGQIAENHGCRVVGVAGSDEKVKHVVDDLGFDVAFNYRGVTDYVAKLKEFCPKGIDVYFDNVGGELTDAVFQTMNVHARICVCGQISQYNLERPEVGPRLLWKLIEKRAVVQGFLVLDYAPRFKEGAAQLAEWVRSGRLRYRETIVKGLENAPSAFIGMLNGENIGKQIVQLSEPWSKESSAANSANDLVTVTKRDGIGVITINNPPVNALSPGVPEGIANAVMALEADPAVSALILIGGGRTFIAGADIKEFEKITSGQKRDFSPMRHMLGALEVCKKPVIAAIHGTALGGGLETAMVCHHRVASPSAQVGQPEVKLGLIPGAGGTQRLPRLSGVAKAAEMCAGGQPVGAADALQFGIVDRVVDGDLLAGAIAFAQVVVAIGNPPRKVRDLNEKLVDADANGRAISAAREATAKRARGLVAPLKAIEAVEAATTLPFDEGLKRERELFEECLYSDQSKALVHVFFAERIVSKIPGLPKDTPVIPIRRAAVVGAGTMGGGITMAYANAGIPVLLKEATQEALDRGLEKITSNYVATVKKGKLTQEQMQERLARIQPTLTYDRFSEADIVVEAVFEGMELKKSVFAELNSVARPDAILASNTSTLDIDEIASVTSRPEQVIGHHFFSPANVMRLLEIVRGKQSSPAVIATSLALAKTLSKVGVLVGNCRGFVGNRMFAAYQREAQFLLEEGARVDQVDAALTEFGCAMGPLAVGDLAGLDVSWRIRQEYKHLKQPGQRDALAADRLCELGRFGQKTGAGWYRYPEGSRSPVPDPEVEKIIADCAQAAGIERREIPASEIIERTIFALINEGAKILEEGFALRASDIDIVYIHGYGFPAYRGGPMWYADTVGIERVYQRICEFEKQHGLWWSPAPLLAKIAAADKTFAALDTAAIDFEKTPA